jgi:ADP-ribose pyrophosphatase YjhB (NUDIX family)
VIGKLYLRALHLAHLARRPLTLGVRGAALDDAGRVFLVRHTYLRGWYLPGGGVSPGETGGQALARELAEEGHLAFDGEAALVSVHLNRSASRRDHVLFYRIEGVRQTAPRAPDREIAECGFFDLAALPEGTTEATRRRLDELAEGGPPDPFW